MKGSPLEHNEVLIPFYQLNVTASDSATAAGGTAAQNHWTSMKNTQVAGVKLSYDVRDTGYVSSIVIEQAQDNVGTGLKVLKTFTLTAAQVAAAGALVAVNVHAAELDTKNDFQYIRAKIVQTGGTATNKFTVAYLKTFAHYPKLFWDAFTLRLPQDQNADGQ